MDNYTTQLDSVFQALSDPTRRAVIQQLGDSPASVKELAAPFDMALPSFMKHIAVLEGCGLVSTAKVGRVRTCSLKTKRLAAAESWLQEQRELWEGRIDRLANYVENEIGRES